MEIHFFGTRGSIATPGPNTHVYGGNTACTFVKSGDTELILDAGTGIRVLGDAYPVSNRPINILLSHNHWDHIQGFPFFAPIYQANREVNIYVAPTTPYQPNAILSQMSGSLFPVSSQNLAAKITVIELTNQPFSIGELTITPIALNHPNGGFAYLICDEKYRFAYVTDNELHTMDNPITHYKDWCTYLNGVDLLIHDAQFNQQELEHRHNWGHSSIEQALQLALDANVKRLAFYSHAPERLDKDINNLLKAIHSLPQLKEQALDVCFSKEGQVIHLNEDTL